MPGHRERVLFRGGQTYRTLMIYRFGVLDAPTDEALAHAMIAHGFGPKPQEE